MNASHGKAQKELRLAAMDWNSWEGKNKNKGNWAESWSSWSAVIRSMVDVLILFRKPDGSSPLLSLVLPSPPLPLSFLLMSPSSVFLILLASSYGNIWQKARDIGGKLTSRDTSHSSFLWSCHQRVVKTTCIEWTIKVHSPSEKGEYKKYWKGRRS